MTQGSASIREIALGPQVGWGLLCIAFRRELLIFFNIPAIGAIQLGFSEVDYPKHGNEHGCCVQKTYRACDTMSACVSATLYQTKILHQPFLFTGDLAVNVLQD